MTIRRALWGIVATFASVAVPRCAFASNQGALFELVKLLAMGALILLFVGVFIAWAIWRGSVSKRRGTLRLSVDPERCNGCEECLYIAPELFGWDDEEEIAFPTVKTVSGSDKASANTAAEACPKKAIFLS